MYMKRMLEVGVATNGYVVECRAELKKPEKGKKDGNYDMVEGYRTAEKNYVAKDEAELAKLINALIPLLDKKKVFTSEDQFDMAFEEAVK